MTKTDKRILTQKLTIMLTESYATHRHITDSAGFPRYLYNSRTLNEVLRPVNKKIKSIEHLLTLLEK